MFRFSLLGWLALSLLPGFSSRADDKEVTPKQSRAARQVRQIIGHKGSSIDRPENTLASARRAIEVKADLTETDIRTSRDGVLICFHDDDLRRTTDGKGKVADKTLSELKKLDAGGWFDTKNQRERIPTLREFLALCKGKIGVMLDLKESGDEYVRQVATEVTRSGEPGKTVLGIRGVDQAKLMRKLLPEAKQVGLVPTTDSIEAFVAAGCTTIRLWPKWLADKTLLPRLARLKVGLLLGAGKGTRVEVLPLLEHRPDMLAADDPKRLRETLAEIARTTKR
jgi:glycerophosphoryl diester phosphodiesterase